VLEYMKSGTDMNITESMAPDGVAPAPRRTFLRGEIARVLLAPCSTAPTGLVARVKELDGPGAWPVPLGADGWAEWDTTGFRAGDYLLEVRSGDAVLTSTALHLRPAERPEMWFGNFFGPPPRSGFNPYLALRELGFNAAYVFRPRNAILPELASQVRPWDMDAALAEGVYAVYEAEALRCSQEELTEAARRQQAQVLMNSEGESSPGILPCIRHPDVIRQAAD